MGPTATEQKGAHHRGHCVLPGLLDELPHNRPPGSAIALHRGSRHPRRQVAKGWKGLHEVFTGLERLGEYRHRVFCHFQVVHWHLVNLDAVYDAHDRGTEQAVRVYQPA